ncbi:hypothetical protein COY05_03365 [Candidatus Peregrinibacteria bacterium CG_4_10_14_0_2_um_filter_38_24]|nr:MAG: hypothetical protein COY05_03365 [Candidatus Peregrinibacteria bacterium CG_4_10_14_0_2_um_filter_38_24]
MKNRYLKGALISSSIAVVTGVLLFGINATLGAPTYQPPGSDVKPTFNGMTSTGTIDSQGEITNSKNLPVLISAPFGVDVRGQIQNNGETIGSKVQINDPLNVVGALSVDAIYSYFVGLINIYDPAKFFKDSTFTANIDAQGAIKNTTASNAGAVKIDDSATIAGGATVTGNIDAQGTIGNSTASNGGAVKIDDADGLVLSSAGDLDLQGGLIKNSSNGNAGAVKINDPLTIAGALTAISGILVDGSWGISNSDPAGTIVPIFDNLFVRGDDPVLNGANGVHIDGDKGSLSTNNGTLLIDSILGVKQNIVNPTGAVKIDDSLEITGDLGVTGVFSSGSTFWAQALAKFDKNVNIIGNIVNTSTSAFGGNPVSIDDDLIVTGTSNLKGNIKVTGDINATGKVTATGGFGTYTSRFNAAAYAIGDTAFLSKSFACDAGEKIVSCFVNSYSADPGASIYTNESGDMQVSGLYIFSNTCWANFQNNSGARRYFKIGAVCFNPAL